MSLIHLMLITIPDTKLTIWLKDIDILYILLKPDFLKKKTVTSSILSFIQNQNKLKKITFY